MLATPDIEVLEYHSALYNLCVQRVHSHSVIRQLDPQATLNNIV